MLTHNQIPRLVILACSFCLLSSFFGCGPSESPESSEAVAVAETPLGETKVSEAPVISEPATAEQVAKPDPVKELQKIVTQIENVKQSKRPIGADYFKTIKSVDEYDVQETNSLVSPLKGIISFRVISNYDDGKKVQREAKLFLDWRDGRWVFKETLHIPRRFKGENVGEPYTTKKQAWPFFPDKI